MPKYTTPLSLDEYDKLTLEEKAVYISDMVEFLKLRREPPGTGTRPPDDKLKTRKGS